MPQESRLKKSLLNARVNLIFYFLSLALSFFSRKIFLDALGADFMGLIGTLNNLLGFLNLAELGISTAIGYVLYKPLFEHDEKKINEIISVFGFIYRRIGFIILSAGCALACFLPLIFPNNVFDLGVIYFAFFSYLTTSLIGYFANYKQTLLGADQKNYVVTAYFQSAVLIKTCLQMGLVYYTGNYYLWISLELLLGIVYSIILNWKVNQVYPWLKSEVKQGKLLFKKYPEVTRYTKQLFVHKLGSFVQFQTTPFLVYAFVSLKTVAYYGNYTLIIDKISIFISNLLGSTNAGVGNLIAEGDSKRIQQVFWELMGIRFLIAGTISFALIRLTGAFISLWLGSEYVLHIYSVSDYHQLVHQLHPRCHRPIYLWVWFISRYLGSHCGSNHQPDCCHHCRTFLGTAGNFDGQHNQPISHHSHLETLLSLFARIQNTRSSLLDGLHQASADYTAAGNSMLPSLSKQ